MTCPGTSAQHDPGFSKIGKRADADHGGEIATAGRAEQRCARADRMADDREALRVHARLHADPVKRRVNVLGKARHRGKRFIVASAVAACVDQYHMPAGGLQRSRDQQHHRGIGTPAVHQHRGWRPRADRAAHGQVPGEQPLSPGAVQPGRAGAPLS